MSFKNDINQFVATCTTSSFTNYNNNITSNPLTPTILMNHNAFHVGLYDCVHDILLISQPCQLFDIVVIVWDAAKAKISKAPRPWWPLQCWGTGTCHCLNYLEMVRDEVRAERQASRPDRQDRGMLGCHLQQERWHHLRHVNCICYRGKFTLPWTILFKPWDYFTLPLTKN